MTSGGAGEPRIRVTEHGPYQVVGEVAIHDVHGQVLRTSGSWYLCRCGGSRNKPFCDATHGLKGFDGTETAQRGETAASRDVYVGDEVTVSDDRSRCAHFGQCTDRLPAVFRRDDEPFVDVGGAPAGEVTDVVAGCPSGALAVGAAEEATAEPASLTPIQDGPYRVRGVIEVVDAHGRPYARRARQTLCRCGHSGNKPFCDGSHWYAAFRDPLPADHVQELPTLFDWVGGLPALERLTSAFYDAVLNRPDEILEPVFRGMDPAHPRHVAAWLAETFAGPALYTRDHGGYEHMLAKHRNLGLTETQRRRWVALMVETADDVGLPDDAGFRSTFAAYLEWGTRLAVANSRPDAPVVEHAPVPSWGWGQTPPFRPQPWDDPDAAVRGRERYARQQREQRPETEEPS